MKKYLKVITLAGIFLISCQLIYAQKKKVTKGSSAKKTALKPAEKFTPIEYGTTAALADVTDVRETSSEYQSLKNLVETNGVTMVYADSTFRPKEPLRRGDFVVSFKSALDAINKVTGEAGMESPVMSTTASDEPYPTSVSEIKDLKESSIYYPAAQSLIEQYRIAAPFAKSKSFNPGATMSEKEVYDILKETLGYNSPGTNPYSTAMTRGKFAMVLNNALNLKLSQLNEVVGARQDSLDDVRRQQEAMVKQQAKQSQDSLARQTELGKLEAQKKEAEEWSKMSESEKRKKLKSQRSSR